jgi:hypothetical protein
MSTDAHAELTRIVQEMLGDNADPDVEKAVRNLYGVGNIKMPSIGEELISLITDLRAARIERDKLRWENNELRDALPSFTYLRNVERLVRKIILVNRDGEQPTTILGALEARTRRQHIEFETWKSIRNLVTEHDEELRENKEAR